MPKPGLLHLPPAIRTLKLKYAAVCACKRHLRKGQSAFYDTVNSRALCKRCVESRLKPGTAEPQQESPAKALIRKIRVAMSNRIPRPPSLQEELKDMLETLRTSHANEEAARQVLIEYYELNLPRSARCIRLKQASTCCICDCRLEDRTAAIWDAAAHRVWCFQCASEECYFRQFD